MKQPYFSRVKQLFFRIFKLRRWSDWDRVTSVYHHLLRMAKTLFVPQWQSAPPPEPFETVLQRLQLTETALKAKQQGLWRAVCMMLGVMSLCLLYSFYQCYQRHWIAAGLSSIIMCIAMAMAFRYHFWFFQIQQRRLGCSLRDWLWMGILRRR